MWQICNRLVCVFGNPLLCIRKHGWTYRQIMCRTCVEEKLDIGCIIMIPCVIGFRLPTLTPCHLMSDAVRRHWWTSPTIECSSLSRENRTRNPRDFAGRCVLLTSLWCWSRDVGEAPMIIYSFVFFLINN